MTSNECATHGVASTGNLSLPVTNLAGATSSPPRPLLDRGTQPDLLLGELLYAAQLNESQRLLDEARFELET